MHTESWKVYRHFKADSPSDCFYVGIGCAKYRQASTKNRNKFWHNIVDKHGFRHEIVADGLTHENAVDLEKLMISEYGRIDLNTGILVNMTNGGDGASGHVHNEETRKKISINSINQKNTSGRFKNGHKPNPETIRATAEANRGRKVSVETREKMSISRKGKKLGPGKKLSPERILAIRIANTGLTRSKETRARMSAAQRGKIISEDARKKMSDAKTKKTVEQYDLNGLLVNSFCGISAAAKHINGNKSTIKTSAQGKRKSPYLGFTWKYKV